MTRKDLLAKIHGYVCSDGGIYSWKCKDIHGKKIRVRRRLRTKFFNKEPALINDFMNAIKLAFPKVKSIKYYPKRIEVEIRNHTLSNEILKLGKVWSHNWEFPRAMSLKQKKLWIRAFSDSEGTVNNYNYDRFVALDSINLKGLKRISNELKKLGISNKLYEFKKFNRSRIKIHGKGNLIKFRNIIGFEHPSKQVKLTEAINSFKK